jgi:short-subunit dehydrogenase involved in D-alanine esterification of teichoic acids
MKLSENTIFITGGGSGIGRGLAEAFHQLGNKVIIGGRRKGHLAETLRANPGMESVELDVADPANIAAVAKDLIARYPKLNVLVNNAGIMLPEILLDAGSLQVAEDTVTTNLLGPIRLVNAFLPQLVAKDDAVIINVSSGLAFVPLPLTPTYNATKAAIHFFTESLRVQLAGTAVQVIELVPPAVRTTLLGQQDSEQAMPLQDFLAEAMNLLRTQPDAREILVENVKFLRYAEANGTYDNVLSMLSGN